jgi:hypothetical protein
MIRDSLCSGRVVVAVLVLSACAYTQPLKPTDHTAVVRAGQWGEVYRGGYVEIVSVSGVEPGWRLHSDMAIPAGDRMGLFYVYLCPGGSGQCDGNNSIAQAQFAFRAEAGHTYRVRAREQVNGSERFWVWLVDEANGNVVGGAPPGTG